MYIKREIEDYILRVLRKDSPQGIILAGVVGSGKTTVVEHCLEALKAEFSILKFSGDDVLFRRAVAEDSKYIYQQVQSRSQQRTIVFVDEIQKSEEIFDAIKYSFDHAKISFIVSGSNPAFLNTVARKRLQRRGQLIAMGGFSLPEILSYSGISDLHSVADEFRSLLFDSAVPEVLNRNLSLTSEIAAIIQRYLQIGGLPLAHLASGSDSLEAVRAVVDRGFESIHSDNLNFSDLVLVELAKINSREFTYSNIFQRTGERRRDKVNDVIKGLIEHGYLVVKRPVFPNESRRSYLCVYSYTDPGIISYLTGELDISASIGARIESVVHTRLAHILGQMPLKSQLGYFKPFLVDPSGSTRFMAGEVDFVIQVGHRIVPIEVKTTSNLSQIDDSQLRAFIKQYRVPYGIVLYGGVPFADPQKKLVFWPWWLV
jgi:predicted AAA+ superfamily ATPase